MNCFQFAPQTLAKRLALFAFALLTFAPFTANAQHEREESTKVNYFENDNAEAMREWLSNYLNPNHDPLYWEKREQGMEQFANLRNYAALKANPMAAWMAAGNSQNDFSSTGGYGEVSGRTLGFAIAADGAFYVSPASGGIWKSIDRGQNWTPISDGKISPMCVAALATDPKDANVVYAGTGEGWAGLSTFYSGNTGIPGTGIYKSTDAGLTWSLLDKSKQIGDHVQKIIVSPANSNVVFAAGASLWRSTDAGATWTVMKNGSSSLNLANGVETVAMDPTNPMVLYAAQPSKLAKTTNGGDKWTTVASNTNGLPQASGAYTAIAVSPKNPNVIYSAVGIGVPQHQRSWQVVGEVGYSTDAGQTWQISLDTVSCPNDFVTQGDYCVALAADPKVESNVVYGGLNIYSSSSYGSAPNQISNSNSESSKSDYSHADIRRLVYYGDTLFALTDGGLHYYINGGWHHEMNNTLRTLQLVGGDAFIAKDGTPKFFIAGAQDNGTTKWTVGGGGFGPIIHGGDGGRCFVDQSSGNIIYATYPEFRPGIAALYRSNDGGASFSGDLLGGSGIKAGPDVASGYEQYDVCESKFSEGVICGASYGWITHNSFNTLTKMATKAGTTSLGAPKYIHISKANPSTIYYGNTNCFWSIDAGVTWTNADSINHKSTAGPTPATFGSNISWITTNPEDESQVYLVTSSQSGTPVYTSTDGGATWTQPNQTGLPTWVYRTIAADNKGRIYIGGDGGVMAYDPKDQTWTALANGVPQGTIITELQVRGTKGSNSGWLIATTYGRGMYYIKTDDIFAPAGVTSNDVPAAPAMITSVYPNPVQANGASTIKYTLESGSQMQIAVFDNLCRQEKLLANEWSAKGEHEKSLDLSGLPAGTHYVMLTADGVSISRPVTIQ